MHSLSSKLNNSIDLSQESNSELIEIVKENKIDLKKEISSLDLTNLDYNTLYPSKYFPFMNLKTSIQIYFI